MNQNGDVSLRQLRYFAVLAGDLHFGKAAARLGIAQPTLSRQIQSLEKLVGTALFERSQRSVSLTAAGAEFAERARVTLEHHDRSLEAARNAAARNGETLVIGFESCAPFHGFPAVVKQFIDRYPKVRFSSLQMPGPEQAEALARHRIDLGFVHPPVPEVGAFIFEPVSEERFIVALPSTHRLAGRKKVGVRELAKEKFVLYPRELAPGCFDAVARICAAAQFTPDVIHESNEVSVSLKLIPALRAVTLFPECVGHQAAPGVTYRDLDGSVTTVTCGFLRRAGEVKGPVERFLRVWRTSKNLAQRPSLAELGA